MQTASIANIANYNIYSVLIDALNIAVRDAETTRQEFFRLAAAPIILPDAVDQVRFVQTKICSIRERYLDECGVCFDLASEINILERDTLG